MREGLASWTAAFTAIARAAHQFIDEPPSILDDPAVIGLVEGSSEQEIRARTDEFRRPLQLLARSAFVLRSRYVEDRLEQAVRAGIRQFVMLGAGLDTFGFRQPQWAQSLRIIEVDHPASQVLKRLCLDRAGLSLPDNLEFCPIDFEESTLLGGLKLSSFDDRSPTFLSWLGVTQYLTTQAITATLEDISRLPRGSELVFSFVLPDACLSSLDLKAARFYAELVASRGEPWLTRFAPLDIESKLRGVGFSKVKHLAPSLANRRYFDGRQDGLRAPEFEQLMCAVI